MSLDGGDGGAGVDCECLQLCKGRDNIIPSKKKLQIHAKTEKLTCVMYMYEPESRSRHSAHFITYAKTDTTDSYMNMK